MPVLHDLTSNAIQLFDAIEICLLNPNCAIYKLHDLGQVT